MENLEYFNYLVSMITNDARCTCEIKSWIAMESNIQEKEEDYDQTIGLKFKEVTGKVLHLEHSYVLCFNLDTSGNR